MEPLTLYLLNATGFSSNTAFLVVGIMALLLVSMFFSASEMAYSTANLIRIRNYADDKVRGARKALYICENYDRTLSTILVANNLCNIASTTIAAFLFASLIANPTLANALNTIIMTIIILIFGEILPKSLAKANAEKLALAFSGTMYFFIIALYPITFLFIKFQANITTKFKKNKERIPTVTEDELNSIIDTMQEEGVIDDDDADLIQGVLELGETTAYDIMTPRVDVKAIINSASEKQLLDMFVKTKHSRIPVFENDIDHIIGIINQKDFFPSVIAKKPFDINKLMTEPIFLSENIKVDEIIRKMQQEKKHMAVVLDEHGGTSGIVSMEDALEQMVGEIYDEHDFNYNTNMFVKVKENEFIVDAEMEVEELFEKLEIENLPSTEYNTIGGFLYELAENLPTKGQKLVFDTIDEIHDKSGAYIEKAIRMIFTLIEMEDRRIRRVKINIDRDEPKITKKLKIINPNE